MAWMEFDLWGGLLKGLYVLEKKKGWGGEGMRRAAPLATSLFVCGDSSVRAHTSLSYFAGYRLSRKASEIILNEIPKLNEVRAYGAGPQR